MIPDFLLERAGMKVYMEVAGYWTPEYLRRKLDQLRGVEDVDMIARAIVSRFTASMRRASAGTLLPAWSKSMSPGTSSRVFTRVSMQTPVSGHSL